MLRHGCGYALANAGHDTRALKAWLGHKNIQHTVRYTELSPHRFLALIVGDRGIDHDPRGWGFEVMGPAGGNGLGQCLRYVDFCVANSIGSTMDGSSFSGLLTRVGLDSDVPAIDLA